MNFAANPFASKIMRPAFCMNPKKNDTVKTMRRLNKTDNTQQRIPHCNVMNESLTNRKTIRIASGRSLIHYRHPVPSMQFRLTSGFAGSQNAVFGERMAAAQRYDHCLDCF